MATTSDEAKTGREGDDGATSERDAGCSSGPEGGVPEILPVRRVDTVTNFDSFITAEEFLTGKSDDGEEDGEEDEDGEESAEESESKQGETEEEDPSGSEFDQGTYATDRCVAAACAELSPVHEDSIAEPAPQKPVPIPVTRCDTMELLASIGGPAKETDDDPVGKRARVK